MTLSIFTFPALAEYHHGDAHERTSEEREQREQGSLRDISERYGNERTADTDDQETYAEAGTIHR